MVLLPLAAWLLSVPVSAAPPKPTAAAADADVFLTVNGTPIRKADVDAHLWKRYVGAAVQDLVDRVLVDQEVRKADIEVTDAEVDDRVRQLRLGADDEAFAARLAANGLTLPELRLQLSERIAREKLLIKARKPIVYEAEVKRFYDENKERMGTPPAVRVRHLSVATEAEARNFLVALRAGADFAQLARNVSLHAPTKDRGGELGFVTKGTTASETEKALFAAKVGDFVGPIKAPDEELYHLFQVEEVRPANTPSLHDAQPDIRQAILSEKVDKLWPEFIAELRKSATVIAGPAARR